MVDWNRYSKDDIDKIYGGDYSPLKQEDAEELYQLQLQQAKNQSSTGAKIGSETLGQYGKGVMEGVTGLGEALSPTKMGAEPDIRDKSPEELKSYQLPKTKSAVEELGFAPPETEAGAMFRSAGRSTPGAIAAPGGVWGKVLEGPGIGAASRAVGDAVAYPFGDAAGAKAEMMATIFGPNWLAKRVAPYRQGDPSRTASANLLEKETGSRPNLGAEFGNKAQLNRQLKEDPESNRKALEDVTRANTRRTGAETHDISGPWFDNQFRRIGNDFDNLAANTWADPRFQQSGNFNSSAYNRLTNVASAADRDNPEHIQAVLDTIRQVNPRWQPNAAALKSGALLPGERLADALFRVTPGPVATTNVQGQVGSRIMNGNEYQRLRTALHEAARDPQMSPDRAKVFRNVADALDDSVEETLKNSGSPLAGKWANTRGQYRALITAEKAAKPGEKYLTPDAMLKADAAISGKRDVLRNDTPFAELNKAAKQLNYGKWKEQPVANEPGTISKAIGNIPVVGDAAKKAAKWLPVLGGVVPTVAGHMVGWPWYEAAVPGILGREVGQDVREAMKSEPRTVPTTKLSQKMATSPAFRPEGKSRRDIDALTRALIYNSQSNQ